MIELLSAPRITYAFECYDKHGRFKWAEVTKNLVTTQGKNDLLDKYLGVVVSVGWYIGLIDNASYTAIAAADTMASHAGWIENVEYDEAARPAVSWSAAAAGVKAASAATVFTIDPTGATIKGAFMTSITTKGGATGILYSASAFAANRVLVDNDVLRVTPTMTIT